MALFVQLFKKYTEILESKMRLRGSKRGDKEGKQAQWCAIRNASGGELRKILSANSLDETKL